MYKHFAFAAGLLTAGITSSYAAEPLFTESGAARSLTAASAVAPGTPFAGDRKIRSARLGLHLNPAAAASSELSLPLPDGRQFNARRFKSYATRSGSTVWVGKHSGAALGTAESAAEETVLVVRNGKVMGTMRHEGKLYRIRAGTDGSHAVAEIDTSQFPRDHAEAEYGQQLSVNNAQSTRANAPMFGSAAAALAAPMIRVMVHYTPAALSTTNDMAALIDLSIAETNQGFINGGVNAQVELAHSAPVSYIESGSNGTDRSRYASVNDRVMDEVHAHRDTYTADVGVLLTEGNSSCGTGVINASATSAFVTVTADCATGNYSFGHELGHLFGARHNVEVDNSTAPFSYGHGYLEPSGKWRTIMAYPCSGGCPRLNYWSNPDKTRDGAPMGNTTLANNARVLNQRAAVMAGFRGDPPNTGVTVTNAGDYNIPDNTTAGVASPVSVNTAGNAGTVTVDVSVIHPYIGDLVLDLIGPDNTVYNLHNRSGGSADNIVRSFSVNAGAKSRVGIWQLRATDRAARDTGYIDSWTLRLQ